MKLINTILILIIIIFLINYFSNGQIVSTLKRIFNSCKENVELFTTKQSTCDKSNIINVPFASQLDFPYINMTNNSNLDKETYELYEFLNDIVTKNVNNYELTPSFSERKKVSKNIETQIIDILLKMFNCKGYGFKNIKLNQDIYYYDNYRGKEIEPFIFTTDIMNNNKNMGNITLLIDSFLRNDKQNNQLTIKSLKIIKRNGPDKNREIALQENNQIITKMNNTFDDIYIQNNDNDIFIKPPNKKHVSFQNNETDSLIPSIDEILSN